MIRPNRYKTRTFSQVWTPILGLILMIFARYICNRRRQGQALRSQCDIPPEDEHRDDIERRDDASRLEDRLREAVRHYEEDLRELAKT